MQWDYAFGPCKNILLLEYTFIVHFTHWCKKSCLGLHYRQFVPRGGCTAILWVPSHKADNLRKLVTFVHQWAEVHTSTQRIASFSTVQFCNYYTMRGWDAASLFFDCRCSLYAPSLSPAEQYWSHVLLRVVIALALPWRRLSHNSGIRWVDASWNRLVALYRHLSVRIEDWLLCLCLAGNEATRAAFWIFSRLSAFDGVTSVGDSQNFVMGSHLKCVSELVVMDWGYAGC